MTLGFNTANDPAAGMFTTANFPGASAGDLTNARALYALLTGRVSAITGTGRLNTAGDAYVYNGELFRAEYQDEYGLWAHDTWRWKPNLTINAGLRYQLQMPLVGKNGVFTLVDNPTVNACGVSGPGDGPAGRFCNMFNPGDIRNPNAIVQYVQYSAGNKGYNTDKNNFSPNIGASWRPNVREGFLRTILGDPEQATVSAGFTRNYTLERGIASSTSTTATPGRRCLRRAARLRQRSRSCRWARAGRCCIPRRAGSARRRSNSHRRSRLRQRPATARGCSTRRSWYRTSTPGTSRSSGRFRATWWSNSGTRATARSTRGRPRTGTR
jgi:hypothetical protein